MSQKSKHNTYGKASIEAEENTIEHHSKKNLFFFSKKNFQMHQYSFVSLKRLKLFRSFQQNLSRLQVI